MSQQESARVGELERRVGQLTSVAIVQSIALVFLLFRLGPLVAIGVLVSLPILAFTHKKLPAFARKCGRFFSFLLSPHSALTDSSAPRENSPTV